MKVVNLQTRVERAITRIKIFRSLEGNILVTMIQRVNDYKNQRKGFAEVTGNFHYNLVD